MNAPTGCSVCNEITNPPIWRTLSVPSDTSFEKLHKALEIGFNWSTTHSYEFHVHDPSYDPSAEGEQDLLSIIRQREVMDRAQFEPGGYQGDANAQREHLIRITDDREWSNAHRPPIDRVHEPTWRHPRIPTKPASQTKLFEVLDKPAYRGKKLTILYDYGDCWRHDFQIVGSAPVSGKIRCTDGEGHYIAEDAGCHLGWKKILDAYRTTSPNKEQKEKRSWFERQASNRDPACLSGDGVGKWDKDGINMKLSVLA